MDYPESNGDLTVPPTRGGAVYRIGRCQARPDPRARAGTNRYEQPATGAIECRMHPIGPPPGRSTPPDPRAPGPGGLAPHERRRAANVGYPPIAGVGGGALGTVPPNSAIFFFASAVNGPSGYFVARSPRSFSASDFLDSSARI